MSDINDITAANNQELPTVVKTSPIRIITVIGTGATADDANMVAAAAFEQQMADYKDTITGKAVVVNSGCNVIFIDVDNYQIQYWAMVRIA
jgi:GTP cyclohydrolase III